MNEISNIDILENVNFKELKELYLHYNEISDIKILEKVKFEKLEDLYLDNNKIDQIKYSSLINDLKNKIKHFKI